MAKLFLGRKITRENFLGMLVGDMFFVPDRITVLSIPDEFQVEAMVAVGNPGPKESLPEELQKRELPNDRKKLAETVCEGAFRF